MEQFNNAQGQVVIFPNNKALRVRPMMSFMEAVKTCFKKYANFSGRARRSEFWWFSLALIIIEIIISIISLFTRDWNAYFLASRNLEHLEMLRISYCNFGGILSLIFCIVTFIPSLSVQVRRFHDVGKSGKWVIVPLLASFAIIVGICMLSKENLLAPIPLILIFVPLLLFGVFGIIFLVWSCLDSKPQTNKWGPSPKYEEVEINTPMSQQQ